MANLNRIILVGRLAADPESRITGDSTTVAKFRLAVERPMSGAKREESVDLIDIVAWQRLAEVCAQYLKKGRLVLVEGRIQNRSFEDQNGQRKWVTEVVARNMTMLDGAPVAGSKSVADEAIDDSELENDLPF